MEPVVRVIMQTCGFSPDSVIVKGDCVLSKSFNNLYRIAKILLAEMLLHYFLFPELYFHE